MLIISKHRDYYDTALGTLGVDKKIVYERHENDLATVKLDILNKMPCRHDDRRIDSKRHSSENDPFYQVFLIAFCGKYYIGYELWWYDKERYGIVGGEKISKFTYDKDEIIKRVARQKQTGKYSWNNHDDELAVTNAFAALHGKETPNDDLFREHKTPVMVYKAISEDWMGDVTATLIINPRLKDYEFAQVFDPFMAFQEISMYIGGVLGTGENNMIVVDEKYRRAAHGFDWKYAFRNDGPPKRKQKKNKNK